MNYNYILAIDPSGAFDEGQGKTGWCLIDAVDNNRIIDIGFLDAGKYLCAQAYWDAHLHLIDKYHKHHKQGLIVVIEEYVLYAEKSAAQINSKMETCRLIGVLQHHCYILKQNFSMQLASLVVNRWNDTVLMYKRIIKQQRKKSFVLGCDEQVYLNAHMKDAIRHGMHYATFRNGVNYNGRPNNKSR